MHGNWAQRFLGWLRQTPRQRRLSTSRRTRFPDCGQNRRGAVIGRLEALESRMLLTNVVAVTMSQGTVTLHDISGRVGSGDAFDVSYTGSQLTLTGHNGTTFRVNGQDQATYTTTVASPISVKMFLNPHGNTVTVTGDNATSLNSLDVFLGGGKADNSLTLSQVVANSINVHGGRRGDHVTVSQTTVNNELNVFLQNQKSDVLDLENTTVRGNVLVFAGQLTINHSSIAGTLRDFQLGRENSLTSTDSTYTGAVTIRLGRDGVINMLSSSDGPNHFHSSETLIGPRGHKPTLYVATNSVVNDVAPKLVNVNLKNVTAGFTAPTVNSLVSPTSTPKITGTYDSTNAAKLTVTVGGKTYTLGTDSQLTSPSAGTWQLDLAGAPLTTLANVVTATSFDKNGNSLSGTGTITNEQSIIGSYLSQNRLTGTKTASGLNYVVTTDGTGAIPTAGQTLLVNYTGYILNSNGTLGTEFDSNIDPQFNHVTPFQFKLGTGAVIKGWDEAFAVLKVGTQAKLLIPSQLAYGTTGSGSSIPANSVLVFDVTLVSAT